MENNQPQFRSDTLRSLDLTLHEMEQDIDSLIQQRDELKEEVHRLQMESYAKSTEEFNTMIAGGMMACLGQPSIKSMSPAAVTMLSRIRSMETIEEVHAYVKEFMEGASKELATNLSEIP